MTGPQQPSSTDPARLERAVETIREEYARREHRPKPDPGAASLESRLRRYENTLRRFKLLPLADCRILDVGCGNGKWLQWCCDRWRARPERCVGADLREAGILRWREEHPDSPITLVVRSSHELEFAEASFDLVHQSMLFSSLSDDELRRRSAEQVWRVLRPGGHLLWYDFFINPVNRRIVPMTLRRIRTLFPQAEHLHRTRITFAPPLARVLTRFADPIIPYLESLKLFNTHYLILFRKPER